MRVPQPFPYQGSKRLLAPAILRHLPVKFGRLVEPFAGSAAVSIACAAAGRAREFWLNDFNRPLADLLGLIVNDPEPLADFYGATWREAEGTKETQGTKWTQGARASRPCLARTLDAGTSFQTGGTHVLLGLEAPPLAHFYRIREDFNRTQDPRLLLYLLARCVKGSVRYNSEGLFNQSPDRRRLGTRPDTMRANLRSVSSLLRRRCHITSTDYRDVLDGVRDSDIVYLDPPYQGVCGTRDARYSSAISFKDLVAALADLNRRGIRYLVSYDGRLGSRTYGEPLPESLDLRSLEIRAGRSSQSTLLGRDEVTFESLHVSPALHDRRTDARGGKNS
jgi:DNA adenine methylase